MFNNRGLLSTTPDTEKETTVVYIEIRTLWNQIYFISLMLQFLKYDPENYIKQFIKKNI
jgi:hypothetical protein